MMRRIPTLAQLKPPVAVRHPQHRDFAPDTVEPDHAIHRRSLDRRLTLQLHTELEKERGRGREIVNDDADVVHPPDRHGWPPAVEGRALRALTG
jgi:hypothetical protein